jgi:integrase
MNDKQALGGAATPGLAVTGGIDAPASPSTGATLMPARLKRTGDRGIYRRGSRYAVIYRDAAGRQHQRSARTLAEARMLRAAFTADVARGEHRELARVAFADYAATWAKTYRGRTGRGIRPRTLAEYCRDLELYAIPFFGRRRLVEIEPRDVKLFAAALSAGTALRGDGHPSRPLAPASVRNAVAPVRILLAPAVEEGLLRSNPATGLRIAGAPRGKVRHLEAEELERLHAEMPEAWRLWLRLLAYTGARIGEFVALRWSDIDLGAGTLTIRRRLYRGTVDTPKSAYGVRTLPLPQALVLELKRHRIASRYTDDDDPLFAGATGRPLQAPNVHRRVFKPAAVRAGVGWAGFHTLRHTCGTLLARKGLRAEEIQAWLGHHAASFTQDVYIGRPKVMPDPDLLQLDALSE